MEDPGAPPPNYRPALDPWKLPELLDQTAQEREQLQYWLAKRKLADFMIVHHTARMAALRVAAATVSA